MQKQVAATTNPSARRAEPAAADEPWRGPLPPATSHQHGPGRTKVHRKLPRELTDLDLLRRASAQRDMTPDEQVVGLLGQMQKQIG